MEKETLETTLIELLSKTPNMLETTLEAYSSYVFLDYLGMFLLGMFLGLVSIVLYTIAYKERKSEKTYDDSLPAFCLGSLILFFSLLGIMCSLKGVIDPESVAIVNLIKDLNR